MAISRWTSTRLKIVAVVVAIGGVVGLVISWLLSRIHEQPYDFAELENGIRNGLTVAGALAATDLLYVQGPRGAWLRRLGFGRAILVRAGLFTALIVAIFALNRLISRCSTASRARASTISPCPCSGTRFSPS